MEVALKNNEKIHVLQMLTDLLAKCKENRVPSAPIEGFKLTILKVRPDFPSDNATAASGDTVNLRQSIALNKQATCLNLNAMQLQSCAAKLALLHVDNRKRF